MGASPSPKMFEMRPSRSLSTSSAVTDGRFFLLGSVREADSSPANEDKG